MHKVAAFLLVASLFAVGATDALAQGKKRARKMGGARNDPRRVTWFANLDAVPEEGKKYILVYVKPAAEQQDPMEFVIMDIVQASHGPWAFVKMDYDRNSVLQKEWGVKQAPACVGLDIHENEFLKTTGLTIESVRQLLKEVPERIDELKGKLEDEFDRAEKFRVQGSEMQGGKLFADLARIPKKGYAKIDAAAAKAAAIAEPHLRELEQDLAGELKAARPSYLTGATYDLQPVDDKPAIVRLRALAEDYRDLAPGVRAEVLLALLESQKNIPAALIRLRRVFKYSGPSYDAEVARGRKLLEEITAEGVAKIELLTKSAEPADRAKVMESLRQFAKDFAGTDAEKKAQEKLKEIGG